MRPRALHLAVSLSLLFLATVATADAATLRVCASGCQFASLQAAIDAAAPGDTILLRAGETFVGPFVLRRKASSSQWITIRSDASDSQLPADGVRLVPSGKAGANTSRSLLPRLIGQGGTLKTTPVVRTEPGAARYVLRFLEIDGVANLGYETLIALGDDTTNLPASDIVIDRVYAHGDFHKGMKRGISLNSARTDILNSYISDIKSVGSDSQAIAGYNGPGPFRIVNNYIEGAAENILFGGADPAVTNLVPSHIEIRRNHLSKPLAWQHPILSPPASPTAAASTASGALASGTHYFRVVALMDTDTRTAVSLGSTVVSASVSANRSATVTWTGVPGANRYRIYRGTSSGSLGRYLETGGPVTSFTYTGASEKTGTPPTSATRWAVKNLLELKNAEHVLIEGNVIENVWQAGQFGYALVLTPRNQSGKAPWSRVRDVMIRNNIVRHASGVLQLSGYDATNTSQQTQRITLENNLFYGIDPKTWGGNAKAYLVGEGARDVRIDRNTLVHTNSSIVYAYGKLEMPGFVYTNNLALHHAYGIMAENGRPGQYSIDLYFPNATVAHNVFAGGPASAYPAPNAFPTVAEWQASLVNAAAHDYRLKSTSVFIAAGAGGSVPGADLGVLQAALDGNTPPLSEPPAPEPSPSPEPPVANTPPVARPGGPYAVATGAVLSADGSASSDAEGPIAAYRWTWGDEILIDAADVPASGIVGSRWVRTQVSGAAGGWALHNPDKGEPNRKDSPLASPASYVEVQFYAAAGVPYRMWARMRAEADHWANDSLFLQFDRTVDAKGAPIHRIGTTSAAVIVLEEGSGAGVAGWGWNDTLYGGTALAPPVYFGSSGLQTLRIQQREDGVMWDQIVFSTHDFFDRRPGVTKMDTSIVPATFGSSDGVIGQHAYRAPGVYPLVLAVADGAGAIGWAATTVTVGPASSTTLTARAGGPYETSVGQTVRLDGSASTVPSGANAQYRWTFGEEVILQAPMFTTAGTRWRKIADTSAAAGVALENPLANSAKLGTALASPTSYVEATFRAAAGVPYRLWIRMRADKDHYANDSVFVQFSGSVTAAGAATTRIGSTSAHSVILEEGHHAGLGGWGWADADYGGLAPPIYFNQDGVQTIRIQQREDGLRIDQVVISAVAHFTTAPGSLKHDTTIVPSFSATGATVDHTYRTAGTYPVTLIVEAGSTGVASDATQVIVR